MNTRGAIETELHNIVAVNSEVRSRAKEFEEAQKRLVHRFQKLLVEEKLLAKYEFDFEVAYDCNKLSYEGECKDIWDILKNVDYKQMHLDIGNAHLEAFQDGMLIYVCSGGELRELIHTYGLNVSFAKEEAKLAKRIKSLNSWKLASKGTTGK